MSKLKQWVIALLINITFLGTAAADTAQVRIALQRGVAYLPLYIVKSQHLIEKYAKEEGLNNLQVKWLNLSGGAALNDALLSHAADYVAGGTLIQLWDKTHGRVHGIAGLSDVTFTLVSNKPGIHSLRDISSSDRIALPAVKSSGQALVLQMLAEREWGASHYQQLDANTVSMPHADAVAALLSGRSEIDIHFTAPPYQSVELADARIHKIVDSNALFGHPVTQAMVYATDSFAKANPKIQNAVFKALLAADQMIAADHRRSATIYLDTTHEKLPMDTLMAIINDPDQVRFSVAPSGTYALASFMHKIGRIDTLPSSWQDFYFDQVRQLKGS